MTEKPLNSDYREMSKQTVSNGPVVVIFWELCQ